MGNKERFVRWQGVLRDQLTFLNNLLLTISFGVLGYTFSLLRDPDFHIFCGQKYFFTVGLILVFLSVVFGFYTAFNRLQDFRTTAKKIRLEIQGVDDLNDIKESIKLYGKVTWVLFYTQLITTVLGVINISIAICWVYKEKLF